MACVCVDVGEGTRGEERGRRGEERGGEGEKQQGKGVLEIYIIKNIKAKPIIRFL